MNSNTQTLIDITEYTTLLNARSEFSELLPSLDGNEEIYEISIYIFDHGFTILSSENSITMKDIVWVLNQGFMGFIDAFKISIAITPDKEEKRDYNIYSQMKQTIRFINFIKYMQKSNDQEYPLWKELNNNIRDIKNFIFENTFDWKPSYQIWAESFKTMEKKTIRDKNGFETYYMAGLAEIIRTISNKKRHKNAYPKKFITDFNFYDDFNQLLGIYNLAIYAFLEMVEAWVSIKPFLDRYDWDTL